MIVFFLFFWFQARPLAFASEVGVAAESQIPKTIYRLAWGLSGIALVSDIATKYMDAPTDKKLHTVRLNIAGFLEKLVLIYLRMLIVYRMQYI